MHEFEGLIEAGRGGGAWIKVPFDVKEAFGTGRTVRVIATYDGFQAKSSIAPMAGGHVLGIHKATREAVGKSVGDRIRITLTQDHSPRVVEVPPALAEALEGDPELKALYEKRSFTHRKEFARWVAEAKKAETRERRVARTLDMLRAGESL